MKTFQDKKSDDSVRENKLVLMTNKLIERPEILLKNAMVVSAVDVYVMDVVVARVRI